VLGQARMQIPPDCRGSTILYVSSFCGSKGGGFLTETEVATEWPP